MSDELIRWAELSVSNCQYYRYRVVDGDAGPEIVDIIYEELQGEPPKAKWVERANMQALSVPLLEQILVAAKAVVNWCEEDNADVQHEGQESD